MPSQTPPEVHIARADDKPVWRLQDRIENGALTPAETKHLSQLIGAVGGLGDTDDNNQAAAHWRNVRGMLAALLAESAKAGVR
jgi:hypothetical protein